jgi:Transposase zinc-ribbon domain
MMTLRELMATFPTEDVCKQFLFDRRWPDGVHCPRCSNAKVYTVHSRPWHWCCNVCAKKPRQPYRFSITVGTIFDNTKYPLKTWFDIAMLPKQMPAQRKPNYKPQSCEPNSRAH